MALTGNIEVFPLPEVLRLLARSGKNGCLRVDVGTVDGRIYLHQGSLTLATVATDAEFLDQIEMSGVVDTDRLDRMSTDGVRLQDILAPDREPGDLTDFVREHVIESLYRIRRPGSGRFEFLVDAESRYRTGQAFDIEQAVSEADRRASDWADIEQTISDMGMPVRMVRELREHEVTVTAPTWRVLAALEGGASIAAIARLLGTTEFRAAREIAGLMRASLIEPATVPSPAPAPIASPPPSLIPEPRSWFQEEATAEETELPDDSPSHEEAVQSPWATAPTAPGDEAAWKADPWSQDTETSADEAEIDAPAVEGEAESVEAAESRGGWWAEAMGASDEIGDVDTDQFLESVFSEAEGSGDDEEESGFSMGLLRRRRMGPASRDISEGR